MLQHFLQRLKFLILWKKNVDNANKLRTVFCKLYDFYAFKVDCHLATSSE